MKKKVFVCAFIAVCLSIVAYGTTAYFSYEDAATNVITAGDVKIELQEWAIPDTGGDPIPFEDVIDVQPGMAVSKIVEVKNTGHQPAWVRISVDKAIQLAAGVDGEADLSLIKLDINDQYWIERDGYYYYYTMLTPGNTTEFLFSSVVFSESMDNMYQYSKAIIEVTAQATQVANNGDSVLEAAGWPKSE